MEVHYYSAGNYKYATKVSRGKSKKIIITPTSDGDIDAIIFLPASWLAAVRNNELMTVAI
jgi:hypothetical protein